MSIRPWFDVWCDHPDCTDWTEGGASKQEAKEVATKNGWKVTLTGKCYCPEHWAVT